MNTSASKKRDALRGLGLGISVASGLVTSSQKEFAI